MQGTYKTTGYAEVRYGITRHAHVPGKGLLEKPVLTYDLLNSLVSAAYRRQNAVADDAPDPQPLLNRRAQLKAFIKASGKGFADTVGDDFGELFDAIAGRAVSSAKAERTKSDLRRGIVWWRRQCADLCVPTAQVKRDAPRPAVGALGAILAASLAGAGWSNARAALVAGVPYMTLVSWLRGATPRPDRAEALARLEIALDATPGSLSRFLRPAISQRGAQTSEYRRHAAALRCDRYTLLPRDAPDQLRDEWRDFIRYKTSPTPRLARPDGAGWTTVARDNAPRGDWHNTLGSRHCPSADVEWRHVGAFLGFAVSRAATYGVKPPTEPVLPSIAWFVVPHLVEAFTDFLLERSRDTVNNRFKTFSNFLRSLVQPTYGWLRQQALWAERIPSNWRPDNWDAACDQVFALSEHWRRKAGATSRDPFEPIRPLLALPEPFQPVLDAIEQLDARAVAAGESTFTGAAAKRDAALLALLICVPLRTRNLALVTLHEGANGVLRREPDGRWWVRVPAAVTKNKREIVAPLPVRLTPRFDEYAALHQPRLAHDKGDQRVFPSRDTLGPWFGVSGRVQQLTEMYITVCPPFHAHAFRHLVATRYLDRHPEDYLTVAHLLGDALQTVIATYSRPDAARAIDRAGRDIDELLVGKRG